MSALHPTNQTGIKLKCNCGSSPTEVDLVDFCLQPGLTNIQNDSSGWVPVWHCRKCGHLYSGRTVNMRKIINGVAGKQTITHVTDSEPEAKHRFHAELSPMANAVETFELK